MITSFDPSACFVETVPYREAEALVAKAHYIGKLGSTSVRLGLFQDSQLVGVICFGTIPGNNASAICGPDHAEQVLELTRLALYDDVAPNSESWLIAQAFQWLQHHRPDISVLISYADASVGHVGTVYQATNWIYTGMSTGDVVYQCTNGSVLHPRTTGWIKNNLPAGKWRPSPGKHRYVIFIGGPARRRSLRRELLWPELPYPKLERAA